MKVKTVKQYQCDFCGKKNYSAPHMKKHELHCTMNPNRVCRMCKIIGHTQQDIRSMLPYLPNPKNHNHRINNALGGYSMSERFYRLLSEGIEALRSFVSNCPACIVSALKRKGIDSSDYSRFFDYKKESQAIFDRRSKE